MAGRKTFKFEPGLNVLFGKNGTGKSTLLLLIARTFHCAQGGYSKITQTSVWDMQVNTDNKDLPSGYRIQHDGNMVFFLDPDKDVGIMGDSFDNDFMEEAVKGVGLKCLSQGERAVFKLITMFENVAIRDRVGGMDKNCLNDHWKEMMIKAEKGMKRNTRVFKTDRCTILIDEPERSLDLENEVRFWRFMKKAVKNVQVIVATHSPFVLFIDDANFVETTPGYVKKSMELVNDIVVCG